MSENLDKTNNCIESEGENLLLERVPSLLEQIHQLRKELKHQEIDGFEFYVEKENLLQELSHAEDKKQLFYELFINDKTAELSNDDKIVALTGITRYDIERFSQYMFRHQNLLFTKEGGSSILENIKKYSNEIFEKLKNEILDLITKLKEIIIDEVKEFLKSFSPVFKDIITKLGYELLKYIIQQINGGNNMKNILITIPKGTVLINDDGENVKFEEEDTITLKSILSKKQFKKLKEFALKIKKLYEDKYAEVEDKINGIISNVKVEVKESCTCGCF